MSHRARFALMITALALSCGAPAYAEDTKRAVTHIQGDLYRFQNAFHFSVLLVTEAGVLVTDPIDAEAAAWLKAEIAERFGKPIRYLVYSHDHADHSSGGEVLGEGAVVVAHENARSAIVGESRPTAVPEVTFNDRLTIELGGKRVELIYLGNSHSDNMIVMHFPAERALFAVDFISVKRLPYRDLSDAYFPDWIEAVKRVEAMDFDLLVPGHGPIGTKEDVTEHRAYLEALYGGVLQAARDGQSLEQMKSSITLAEFSHLGQYGEWRELNIEGMYRQISLHRRGN